MTMPQLPPLPTLKECVGRAEGWPAPESVSIGPKGYQTPEGGPFVRVTRICDIIGTSKQGLINWSADTERAACLEACREVFANMDPEGPDEFARCVELKLGPARQHQKELTKAADIGTAAHDRINWGFRQSLGQDVGPEPQLPDPSLWAFMAFEDWFKGSGLRIVRTEQPVWDKTLGFAGTIDAIAEDTQGRFGGGLGVLDFKTSKAIYDTHHVQVAAYHHAGRRWADLRWAQIVRLPKVQTDPATEVKTVGDLRYDYIGKGNRHYSGGKIVTLDQLWDTFRAALTIHNVLLGEAA